jgi:CheY-like chemotaxis protein
MTEDQQAQIFAMFYQGEASTTRKYGGSGLGLPICKDIIELMGGQIRVSSQIDHGSVFKFSCVLEKRKVMDSDNDQGMVSHGIRLLVAEDDEISRLLLKKFSKNLEWQITLSKNGQELLQAYKKDDYDLILMDVNMPIMDGLQACKKIRQVDDRIPIIGISAFASSSDVKTCLDAGMNATVSKPIDFKLLQESVAKWLRK